MSEPKPTLRVVRGQPTAEELAAVTALIATAAAGPSEASSAQSRGRWADPSARVRRTWRPGPGAWRASDR